MANGIGALAPLLPSSLIDQAVEEALGYVASDAEVNAAAAIAKLAAALGGARTTLRCSRASGGHRDLLLPAPSGR